MIRLDVNAERGELLVGLPTGGTRRDIERLFGRFGSLFPEALPVEAYGFELPATPRNAQALLFVVERVLGERVEATAEVQALLTADLAEYARPPLDLREAARREGAEERAEQRRKLALHGRELRDRVGKLFGADYGRAATFDIYSPVEVEGVKSVVVYVPVGKPADGEALAFVEGEHGDYLALVSGCPKGCGMKIRSAPIRSLAMLSAQLDEFTPTGTRHDCDPPGERAEETVARGLRRLIDSRIEGRY